MKQSRWLSLLVLCAGGGAFSSAVILAMIVGLFPEPAEQARAFGVFSFIASAGAAIGLVAGGVITQTVNWHWIFFVNVPLGALTAICALRVLPSEEPIARAGRPDVLGAALITFALMLGVYAIVTATLIAGIGALLLLAAFVVRQARAANSILPLRILRSRVLSGANAALTMIAMSDTAAADTGLASGLLNSTNQGAGRWGWPRWRRSRRRAGTTWPGPSPPSQCWAASAWR